MFGSFPTFADGATDPCWIVAVCKAIREPMEEEEPSEPTGPLKRRIHHLEVEVIQGEGLGRRVFTYSIYLWYNALYFTFSRSMTYPSGRG